MKKLSNKNKIQSYGRIRATPSTLLSHEIQILSFSTENEVLE